MPAWVNSDLKSVSKFPIVDIFISICGPLPESNLLPVKLPKLILNLLFSTLFNSSCIFIGISEIISLKLFQIAMGIFSTFGPY